MAAIRIPSFSNLRITSPISPFPTPSGLMIERVRRSDPPRAATSVHPGLGHVVPGHEGLFVHFLRPLRHPGEDGLLHRLDPHLPGDRGDGARRDDVRHEGLADLLRRRPDDRQLDDLELPLGDVPDEILVHEENPVGLDVLVILAARFLRQRELQVDRGGLRVIDHLLGNDHLGLGGSAARLGTVGLALHRIDLVVDGRRLGEDDPREDQPLAARTGKPDLVSSAHLTPPSPLSVSSGARPSRSRYLKTPEPLSCREPPWETCRRSFREGASRRPKREAPYPSSTEACPWGSGTCSGARGSGRRCRTASWLPYARWAWSVNAGRRSCRK